MGQRIIAFTIRLSLPEDTTSENQKILIARAEEAINDGLEEAGLGEAVIGFELEAPTRVEDLVIESMPTIADLLDDEEDED